MRKLAPVFLLSSIVALSCGSAFALGDMNKNKQAPRATTSDATMPADKTYTSPTNPSTNGVATASDTGKGGATAGGSSKGSSMENASPSMSSSGSAMSNDSSGMDAPKKKWTAKDCQGVDVADPQYKSNNCASMKGGPG